MPFITDDFLLSNDTARRLYHEHAAKQPIFDYHCHLPPQDLAGNRRFNNLFEAWLEGDHYKWRAMRANGVDEAYCTGDAKPYDKFLAFARTVPMTLRNPLYHWCHLELKRYFDIDVLLSGDTAREVWDEANRKLADLPVAEIVKRFDVAAIGTTDAPADSLEHHKKLASSDTLPRTAVVPTFRPDKLHDLSDPAAWQAQVAALGEAAGVRIKTLDDLLDAVAKRHAFFHSLGGRCSDHGLTHLPEHTCTEQQAKDIFRRAMGEDPDFDDEDLHVRDRPKAGDQERFTSFMMLFFAELDHAAGWTHQLHLGAMRNNNGWAMEHLGPDTGYDSIGDYRQAPGLRRHLGELARRERLPQAILYNHNPSDNYLFATMAGNYQGGPTGKPGRPGKVQFGSGWWFLDQKEGMTWQINALSNLGLLPRFVGMLTDSRSFLSFPRHEYFRRLLCDILGRDAEAGELPDDLDLLGDTVEAICFGNARDYFGIELKR
ncbi:MAG: glucuronate isomerase [Planctomycetota bacterium]